jgi:hypothetical protein
MKKRWIEASMVPFATSIGAASVQFLALAAFIVLCGMYPGSASRHQALLRTVSIFWFLIPLISIIGITSSIVQVWKKERIFVCIVGLILNCAYLTAGVYLAIGSGDSRFWAS